MKLRHRIAMCFMNGENRRLGDILGYLLRSIDPKMAVRKYLIMYRSDNDKKQSLDYQIKFGSKLMIKEAIRTMVDENILCQSEIESDIWRTEDTIFEITNDGKEWLKSISPGNNPLDSIFEEFGRLYRNGNLEFSFTIKNSAGAF